LQRVMGCTTGPTPPSLLVSPTRPGCQRERDEYAIRLSSTDASPRETPGDRPDHGWTVVLSGRRCVDGAQPAGLGAFPPQATDRVPAAAPYQFANRGDPPPRGQSRPRSVLALGGAHRSRYLDAIAAWSKDRRTTLTCNDASPESPRRPTTILDTRLSRAAERFAM